MTDLDAPTPLELNELQSRMLAAYVQGRYITGVRAAWGSGKSFGLGLVAALAGDQRPGDAGVWVTDTRSRLEAVVMPACERILGARYGWRFRADPSKFYWEHPSNGFRLWLRMYYRASTRSQDQNPLEGFNGSVGLIDERVGAESMIETPDGPMRIADLVADGYRGLVLGFDHCEGRPTWTAVVDTASYTDDRDSYRFTFSDGSVLECTGEHPIWVDGTGYVAAANLFVRAAQSGPAGGLFVGLQGREQAPLSLVVAERILPLRGACDLATGTRNYFASGVLVHNCQALRAEALTALQGRVRTKAGDGVIVCVGLPVWDAWWMKAAEKLGPRGCTLYATTHVNAANLDPNYVENLRATLSPEMFASRVENVPFAPVGQVLNNWSPDSWPRGNVIDGWQVDRSRPVRIAVDFGRRSPAVLFVQSSVVDGQQVDVVFSELMPDDCLVGDLCARINAEAARWGVRVEAGAGDPAGKAVNDQTGVDSINYLARSQSQGGVGVRLRYETDPIKRHVPNGVERLRRRILGSDGVRRLVVTREMWDRGDRAGGRTLRRCVEGYRYPEKGGDEPLKDGVNDHGIDALRYDAICWHWRDGSAPDNAVGLSSRAATGTSPVAGHMGDR